MIEINLLPEEHRKTEGTPPARLLTIVLSVALVCGLGAMISSYYLVKIPAIKNEIATADSDIRKLEEEKKKVEETRSEINNLKQKVAALDNLSRSRIRYARVLNQLCNAVPEGVWFKTFSVTPDNTAPALGVGVGGTGKRYQIALTGYTTGASQLEMDRKLTELLENLTRAFEVPAESAKPAAGQPVPPEFGWSKFIGAKFDRPRVIGLQYGDIPKPIEIDPKASKLIETPHNGNEFTMTLSFELPPKM